MTEAIVDRKHIHVAAIEYARRGWRVLPVGAGPDRKLPCIKNWTQAASSDELQIAKWWQQFPDANIGIATGPRSGFWVVDVDIKNGVDGLKSLRDRFGDRFEFDLDRHIVGKTATGGIHFLFQWDPEQPVRNAQAVLPGVDIRGDGGQIVVAPSVRRIGSEWVAYRWNATERTVSPITPWARELITASDSGCNRPVDLVAVMTGLTEGARDNELWRYACHLARRGVPMPLAASFITEAAARCRPPFDPEVALGKVIRAYGDQVSRGVLSEAISTIEREITLRKETSL
jgi:hypothetical protein